MWGVILRRIAIAIPLLFVVATISFALVHLLPGDPGRAVLGISASAQQVKEIDHQLGFDRPVLTQYVSWLGAAVRGDLGRSIRDQRSVTADLSARIPVTISLALGATLLATIVGIGFGMLSAIRGGWADRTGQSIVALGIAVPNFWLAVLLVELFSIRLRLLPAVGYDSFTQSPSQWLRYMALPIIAIGVGGMTGIARQTRAAMLDVLSRDYVRTLAAAGLSRRSILFKHGLRNAAIPVVTNVGFAFMGMLGGAVIIEPLFVLPGVGQWTLTVIGNHDLPEIEGVVVYTTAIVLLVNLLVDVASAWLNPKMRRA